MINNTAKTSKFKQRTRCGSWPTFERRFQPIEQSDGRLGWEREELPADVDPHLVWTVVDAEGKLYVTPGIRFVDRLYYIQCAMPWSADDQRQPPYLYW